MAKLKVFTAEEVKDEVNNVADIPTPPPCISDPEWSDYVLSLLSKDEMSDDKPTTDGLRRVAIFLFGEFDILPLVVHQIDPSYAAVTATLRWPESMKQVSGSAEVTTDNTETPYSKYPLATAETRAIGRALKMALNLKRVITAEESSRKASISTSFNEEVSDSINSTQIKYIELVCKKHNISIVDVVRKVINPQITKITDLNHEQSLELQKQLDEWVRNDDVPRTELGDYNPSWRTDFY